MTDRYIVTGTDTGIGKTVFAAGLSRFLGADYWKPIQAGTQDGTDAERVRELCGDKTRIHPEAYVLSTPCSPHRSAELDGVEIDASNIHPPETQAPLVIEGAGGVLVPITRRILQPELFTSWACPVILCARTALGTINHTLMSIEVLRARNIPLLGIAFIGDEIADTIKTIADFSGAKVLGRLPHLERLDGSALDEAFEQSFNREDFS